MKRDRAYYESTYVRKKKNIVREQIDLDKEYPLCPPVAEREHGKLYKSVKTGKIVRWERSNKLGVPRNLTAADRKYHEEKRKAWRATKHGITTQKLRDIRYKYGIEKEVYFQMFKDQNNRCAMQCGNEVMPLTKRAHVDHDHKTGRVRGILCNRCNLMLGFFEKEGARERVDTYLVNSA